jgi:transcriptional regulator with XRE-family HTH domain
MERKKESDLNNLKKCLTKEARQKAVDTRRKSGWWANPEKSKKRISETRKKLLKEGKIKLPKQLPEKKIKQILKLHEEGKLKTLEIAEKVGCSRVSVSRYTKPKRDVERNKEIKKFVDNLNNLSERDRGYIAGILDGEGSIVIQKTTTYKKPNRIYYGVVIGIGNQDKEIMKFIYEILKLRTKIYYYKDKKNIIIKIYGKDIITKFLKFILPYCHSRKTEKRGKVVLRFCKARTHKERKELYNKIKRIKEVMDYKKVPINKYARGEREEQLNKFKKDLNKLSEDERGYLAGILDGEGSITITLSVTKDKPNQKYYTPSISFGNQDKKIINWIYKRLKTRVKLYLVKSTQKDYIIKIHGKKTIKVFLNFISPYIHSDKTKKRAETMLNFCEVGTKKEKEELYKKLRIYFNRKNIVNKK